MENLQYSPQATLDYDNPQGGDSRSSPEHRFRTLTNQSLEPERSRAQDPSAPCISPSPVGDHDPEVLEDEAHVAQHERPPFPPRSGGDVGVEPQEYEGLLAGNTNIQRKPVALFSS
ncbi:hypothetical protein CMUS01_01314 [Colletotrichum musicola]|uniref:Uncharacterized protein n=1 Tax=Colletotrichum musicola TaxID=2175873 RepID=A0A8H6U875_9PEZI|nr:hypothetical protein CMUS01_01314 [Colletotrichum musicola]